MERILITGAAGYLAWSLINLLRGVDCQIVRLGRPGTEFVPLEGFAKVTDVTGDIREETTWKSALTDVDTVFHFAAQTSVSVAHDNPDADFEANVSPMLCLLETCRKRSLHPTVLFAGTVTQTGIPPSLSVDESHPDHPITIYDLHKLMAEGYLKYYSSQGIVRGATLRLANVFGPGPKSSGGGRGMLNEMVRKALSGETLTIYGQGEPLRDYIYVEEVIGAFLKAANHIDRVNGQYFVIGSGKGHTIAEAVQRVAERVLNKTGQRVRVENVDSLIPQSRVIVKCCVWRRQAATSFLPDSVNEFHISDDFTQAAVAL